MRSVIIIVIVLFFSSLGYTATYYIPNDFGTIQGAIDACANYDTLIVKPGWYQENINFKGKAIILKSEQGPAMTRILGSNAGSVVTCNSGEMADTELEGFTLSGGKAPNGGGMYNEGASPKVTHCIFSMNEADSSGGGMYNFDSASPILLNCEFKDNTALYGGGIYNDSSSSPKVTQCEFRRNHAERGGGIYNVVSSPTINQCTFLENTTTLNGGGIYNYYASSPEVSYCTFKENCVMTGAGMFNSYYCSPKVLHCTFQENVAYTNGGGVYNESHSSPTVIQSIFQGNLAYKDGGGVFSHAQSNPILTQCVFYGNSVDKYGGDGGGIRDYNGSKSTVTNCILWNNTPEEIVVNSSSPAVVTYSCIQGGYSGTKNISSDPCFLDPANMNFHLLNASQCIDAGNNYVPNLPAYDFEGDARIMDGDGDGVNTVDIGVDECHLRPCEVWVDDDWMGSNYNDPVGGGRLFGIDAFDNIQDGISSVAIGGEVHVADGDYKGEKNRHLNFYGRALTLKSDNGPDNCIIDCEKNGRAFDFISKERSDSCVEGFTIQNGKEVYGGGMYIEDASPKVTQCVFKHNNAEKGGGIYNVTSSPRVTQCTFLKNTTTLHGGGIYNIDSSSPEVSYCTFKENSVVTGGGIFNSGNCSPEVLHCVFQGNTASVNGGGVYNESHSSPTVIQSVFQGNSAGNDGGGVFNYAYSKPMVTQCTFYGNSAVTYNGGGIRDYLGSMSTVTNCILWNDTPEEIVVDSGSPAVVTYSCVQGGYSGIGNIPYNPLFCDPANNDFHLTYGSPCKNKGDDMAPNLPVLDFEGDPRISYGAVDMGVDEYHPHMYYAGDATPGGAVSIKFVGVPGEMVRLFLGVGVLPAPLPTMYGDWYLQFPLLLDMILGLVPNPDGILVFSAPIPVDFPAPMDLPFQSGIGYTLSNLCVMEIK